MADVQELIKESTALLEKDKEYPDGSNRKQAHEKLKAHYEQYKNHCEFQWRLSRATYLYMQTFVLTDKTKHKELCAEAKRYAFEALALNGNDPDAHKFCAMTLGTSNEYAGTNEKIKNGHAMKHHLDEALKGRPEDRTVHHLLGRWCYNVAALSWLERKVAAALFSSPPESSYEEALKHFMEVERLTPDSWKENQLYVALCHEQLRDKAKAKEWLQRAERIPIVSADDEAADKEIKRLLSKY